MVKRKPTKLDLDIEAQWSPDDTTGLPKNGWLGIDVGFIYPAVDSDGHIYRWAGYSKRVAPGDTTVAGPVTVRKLDGTVYTRDPYDTMQLADVFARAKDDDYRMKIIHLGNQVVAKARRSERGLALEDWKDFSARRSSWTDVWKKVMEIGQKNGVAIRTVNPAWTSVRCPECGVVDKKNRPNRDTFLCVSCGHTGQSDRIAALNIQERAIYREITSEVPGTCSNPPCPRHTWANGLCCSCYFHRRRRSVLPDAKTIERLALARDWREFMEQVGHGYGLAS